MSAPVEAIRAMHALLDCGVVRASWGHAGYANLTRYGLASRRPVSDRPWAFDYRLTPLGREKALRILRRSR